MKRALLFILVLLIFVFGFSMVSLYDKGEKALEEALDLSNHMKNQVSEKAQDAVEATPAAEAQSGNANSSPEDEIVPTIAPNTESSTALTPETSKENQSLAADINKVNKKMPVTEKVSISATILKKLTPADISELKGMLADGVTAEEKSRAKQILYSRLSSEDIEKIKEAYYKYSNKQ